MTVPAEIRAGATIQWVEPAGTDLNGNAATSASWTLTTYLRTHVNHEGATVVGTARSDGGWNMAISASTSTGFEAGTWYWETRLTSGALVIPNGYGTFTVLSSLYYTGQPSSFDGRSQAEKDLEAVQAAIRDLVAKKAQQYTIGSRSFTAQNLGQLMQREAQLKAVVARERAAEKVAQGLGNPGNLFVRFS